MLVTNPATRAPLSEVLAHPWMTRGYPGVPVPHVLPRDPLRADTLDRDVIVGMTGFEFGTVDEIEQRLKIVLSSDAYLRAVSIWERARGGGKSTSSLLAVSSGDETPQRNKSKRFSGFDFYRRKLLSPTSTERSTSPTVPSYAQDALSDPTRAFHPLVSIYYLSKEKMDRERVYGPGQFASSQLSLEEDKLPPSPPMKNVTNPITVPSKADYAMVLPRLPPPASPHYSGMSYENNAGAVSPSPTSAQFGTVAGPQPRARDSGLTNSEAESPRLDVPMASSQQTSSPPVALPPASQHRRSHSLSQRPTGVRASLFGTERDRERDLPPVADELGVIAEPDNEREKERVDLPLSATLRRFGSLLGGRGDESKKKRSTILGGIGSRPSDVGREREKDGLPDAILEEDTGNGPRSATPTSHATLSASQSQPLASFHRRAATILDPTGRLSKHERRGSTGGTLLPSVGGTFGRMRRPSTGQSGMPKPLSERIFGRGAETDTEAPAPGEAPPLDVGSQEQEEDEKAANDKEFKPIFMKGLFR